MSTSFTEFLILPKCRRSGIGTEAATWIIRSRPGRWEIAQLPGNTAAVAFWRRAIPVPFDERELADGTTRQTFVVDA